MGAGTEASALGAELSPARDRASHNARGIGVYFTFVKPHIDVTFVLVGLTGALLAWRGSEPFPLTSTLLLVGAVALLSAGAESWTNILDRDLDAVMRRTSARPLVTGQITVGRATVLASSLTVGGLGLSLALGPVPLLFLLFALISNVVVYSLLTKRATPWSVVLGSAVGSLTLWAGYTAIREPVSGAAWLLGGMVGVWVFVHIWVIAIRYRSDYALGRVPTAPLTWTRGQLTFALAASALAMGALAVGALLALGGPAGRWAAIPVGTLSGLILLGAALAPWRPGLAAPLIRVVTIYLVLVLGVALTCAL